MRRFYPLLLLVLAFCHSTYAATKTEQPQQPQKQYSTRGPRRERNLDHWDADTLSYYLGIDVNTGEPLKDAEYVGTDAAVMFYAQWCHNCHALAPSWDAIATHVGAGTVQSKLIMALFDCELDYKHMKLCTAAGVKHYPTLMFIGSGPFRDTDAVTRVVGKDKSAGPAGASPLPRTVKFQGNWQYPDSVLDWVRTMQGLSKWHQWTTHGFLRFMREGIMGLVRKPKKKPSQQNLPVGIPMFSSSSSSSTTESGISSPIAKQEVLFLESKLKDAKEETKKLTKLATHASLLISSTLFPPSSNKTEAGYVDVFAQLTEKNAWDKKDDLELQVAKTCIMALALDYCSRLTTRVATDYVEKTLEKDMPSMKEIEAQLKEEIKQQEPYCDKMYACIADEFKSEECRPATCPFAQDVACRYLTACTEKSIQKEYAVALGFIKEGDAWPPVKQSMAAPRDAASGGGGWGMLQDEIDQLKAAGK